jgi:AcrR family transcriptional regulator
MEGRPEPKRRNAALTRARILEAAFEAFARHGYARTGIREIARDAEVATSLLVRYFGTKANLFREALIHGIYEASVFTHDRARFGKTMARLMTAESDSGSTGRLVAMTVLAIADPESAEVARKVVERHVIEPLADWLGPPQAAERAMSMYVLMLGFMVQVRQLSPGPVPAWSVRWLARSLQEIVDGGG